MNVNLSKSIINMNNIAEIIICEDNIGDQQNIANLISEFCQKYKFAFAKTTIFDNVDDFFQYVSTLSNPNVIIILDVIIKNKISIELINKYPELFVNMQIMLVTSNELYKKKVYRVKHSYFIEKHELGLFFEDGLTLLLENISNFSNTFLNVFFKNKKIKIRVSYIKYIQSNKRMLEIYCLNEKEPIIVNMKLDDAEKLLSEIFIRCHKSYLVNFNYIKIFSTNFFTMQDGLNIRITPTYKKNVVEKVAKLDDLLK